MATGQYKHWDKAYRNRSYEMVKKAEALGWIKPRCKCNRCPQTEGIIHLHCENYDVTTEVLTVALARKPKPSITPEEKEQINSNDVLEVLCWRCHMMHHSANRAPEAHKKYFDEVAAGKVFPPVLKHNFAVLSTDHGVK